MLNISINLPKRFKLSLKIEKKRGRPETPILPDSDDFAGINKGKKITFLINHIVRNSKFKKFIGKNLAIMIFAASLIPTPAQSASEYEMHKISTPVVLNTENSIQYPVSTVRVTQGFRFYHQGIDFDGVTGDVIYPIMNGKVVKIEYSRFGYGKSILIKHNGNTESLYAHLSKIDVYEGQEVTKDTKIGEMGATGRSFGDHLHLEIYENGKAINPLHVLSR